MLAMATGGGGKAKTRTPSGRPTPPPITFERRKKRPQSEPGDGGGGEVAALGGETTPKRQRTPAGAGERRLRKAGGQRPPMGRLITKLLLAFTVGTYSLPSPTLLRTDCPSVPVAAPRPASLLAARPGSAAGSAGDAPRLTCYSNAQRLRELAAEGGDALARRRAALGGSGFIHRRPSSGACMHVPASAALRVLFQSSAPRSFAAPVRQFPRQLLHSASRAYCPATACMSIHVQAAAWGGCRGCPACQLA